MQAGSQTQQNESHKHAIPRAKRGTLQSACVEYDYRVISATKPLNLTEPVLFGILDLPPFKSLVKFSLCLGDVLRELRAREAR
jgi:hypothetical protein